MSQIILKEETAFDPTTTYSTKAIRENNQLIGKRKERKEKTVHRLLVGRRLFGPQASWRITPSCPSSSAWTNEGEIIQPLSHEE